MTTATKTLGELTKEHWNRLQLTQEEVAKLIDSHPQYYKNLENDKRNPSIPLFCKIMRTLNTSADAYITPNSDQTDPDYQEMIQIFNQYDAYQRSVLLATGRALIKKKPLENSTK